METLKKLWQLLVDFFNQLEKTPPPSPNPTPTPVPTPTPAPNPPSTPPTVRTLKKGDVGDDVKKIQQKLKEIGYAIDVDGEYGNETENAVINFQRYNGIGQTGQVGPQTLAAILSAKAGSRPNSTGAVAAADLGEKEGKRGLYYSGKASEAEKYLASLRQATGESDRYPWCGAFVYWCFKQAGVAIPAAFSTGYTAAYCPGWETWARAKGWWYNASASFVPRRGDIVLFNWNGDQYADHIGIVLANNGSYITTAEGNTSNLENGNQINGDETAVKQRNYSTIKGFIRF